MKSFLTMFALTQSFFWMGAAENPNLRGLCGLLAVFLLLHREISLEEYLSERAALLREAIEVLHKSQTRQMNAILDFLSGPSDDEETEQATH